LKLGIAQDPNNYWVHQLLANLYSQMTEDALAVQEYESALKLIPNQQDYQQTQILNCLVPLYFKTHQTKKALEVFESLLSQNQNEWQTREMLQRILQNFTKPEDLEQGWELV